MHKAIRSAGIALVVLHVSGCSVAPTPDQPLRPTSSQLDTMPDPRVVILDTGDPEYAISAVFPDGEVLVAKTDTDSTARVSEVNGAVFIAADGRTIDIDFEAGLPVRAIADSHIVQFSDFTGESVDVTIIAPNGDITVARDVPFQGYKISQPGGVTGAPLGSGVKKGRIAFAEIQQEATEVDWILFASTALGAFSCAATIASGGTLSILFGAGCALFAYTTYLKATGKDGPVVLTGAGIGSSAIGCGRGLGEKNPIAASSCAKLVVDVARSVSQAIAAPNPTEGSQDSQRQPTATLTSIMPTSAPVRPTLTITEPTWCRRGPSKLYSEVWSFKEGTTVSIMAAGPDGWYLVERPEDPRPSRYCWVGTGHAAGDLASLPVATAPSPPESGNGQGLTSVEVGKREISISVRDSEAVDGDQISLYVNGKKELNNYTLTGTYYKVKVELKSGDNKVTIKALNTGDSGPNTIQIRISGVTSGASEQVSENLQTGETATLHVRAP